MISPSCSKPNFLYKRIAFWFYDFGDGWHSKTTQSCIACEVTGAGMQTCTDSAVAVAPAHYDYVVTRYDGSTLLGFPEDDEFYRISVPIPPANMILVQRNAVNYEICQQMGRASDPLNMNRCVYSGLGAVPYSTGPGNVPLGLLATHYDFGYNLFVDRWTMGCAWTTLADGGMCGAGATAGDCNGTAVPAGTIGVDGNVYYNSSSGQCYLRDTTWKEAGSGTLSAAQLAVVGTSDPSDSGGKVPPLVLVDQPAAYNFCANQTAAGGYGAKRLVRGREWIAMTASPVEDEAGYMTDTQIAALESGTSHSTSKACNSNHHDGVTLNAGNAFPTGELAGSLNDVVGSFILGSDATSACVSRYGLQDYVGNVLQWTSTYLSSCSALYVCDGAQSPYDDGNRDLVGFQFGGTGDGPGTNNWFVMNWDGSVSGSDPSPFPTYFSLPLGIPLMNDNGGNAISLTGFGATRFHGDTFTLNNWPSGAHGSYAGGYWDDADSVGRWKQLLHPPTTVKSEAVGFRCSVAAE